MTNTCAALGGNAGGLVSSAAGEVRPFLSRGAFAGAGRWRVRAFFLPGLGAGPKWGVTCSAGSGESEAPSDELAARAS